MLDPLDWVDGWPVVMGGPSNEPRPAPALRPDQVGVRAAAAEVDQPGPLLSEMSEEFDDPTLGEQWSWLREPAKGDFGVEQNVLSIGTTNTDLFDDRDDAPVLLRDAPAGDYMLETKVALDLPPQGCCFNYVQAGLVVHGDDDNYLKLVVVSIWETRQIEFAREMAVPAGFHRYGGSVASPPGDEWTWLRVAVRRGEDRETYTAYTSRDGEAWVRGSTWTHELGEGARIGLLPMGGPDFTARFDYLRVFDLVE